SSALRNEAGYEPGCWREVGLQEIDGIHAEQRTSLANGVDPQCLADVLARLGQFLLPRVGLDARLRVFDACGDLLELGGGVPLLEPIADVPLRVVLVQLEHANGRGNRASPLGDVSRMLAPRLIRV